MNYDCLKFEPIFINDECDTTFFGDKSISLIIINNQ